MAINPLTYQTPSSFIGDIDWGPLTRLGEQIKQQRQEEEAARLLTKLYDQQGSGYSYVPQAAQQQAGGGATTPTPIQTAMLPPVPGYNISGNPVPTAPPAPAAPGAPGLPADQPPWLQSGMAGNYSPRAPQSVDPRSIAGRLMARMGRGNPVFPDGGAAPVVPGLDTNALTAAAAASPDLATAPPWLRNAQVGSASAAPFPAPAPADAPAPAAESPAPPAEAIPLPRERPVIPDVQLPPTQGAPGVPEVGAPPPGIENALRVIRQKESGGNYANVTTTRRRDGTVQHALGAYGVMDRNVPQWTREALGRELTPDEFLANKAAQDAVARYKFGQYAQKYGTTGAARAWFAGEGGMNNPGARDPLGTSVAAYSNDFDRRMGNLPPEITSGTSRPERDQRMALDATEAPAAAPQQRALQNLASQQPAAAADISSEDLAAMFRNPVTRPLATAFLQKKLDPGTYKFMQAGDNIVRYNERTGQYDLIDSGKVHSVKDDDKLVTASGKVVYGNEGGDKFGKLPSGYRWKDPNNKALGVDPIPGSSGTQMPAEVAAKVGLGEAFLKRLPTIRQKLEADALGIDVNPTAHLAAVSGSVGPGAEIKRQIESGADSLLRMLTGAGMGVQEAEKYVKRYEVNARDTKGQLLSKMQQLEEDMHATAEKIGQGRGGNPLNVPRVFADAPNSIAPGAAPTQAPSTAAPTISRTKVINGTTYGQIGDKWYPLNAARQ